MNHSVCKWASLTYVHRKTHKSFLISFVIHVITVVFVRTVIRVGGSNLLIIGIIWRDFCLLPSRERGLLAASGQRPVMPLDSLQCLGLPLPGKDDPTPDVIGAKVEKPCLRSSLKIDCISQTLRFSLTPSIRLGLLGIRQNHFFFFHSCLEIHQNMLAML